jgi:predicted O-methyltransferase YrrM
LKYCYLAYFSKPICDRLLYGTIRRLKPRHILEIGIGAGLRAQRMISVALRYQPADAIRYVGVDLFEARQPAVPAGLTFKSAHCLLKATGVRVQLVPGDVYSALSRTANSLRENDLVLISHDQDKAALEQAWFFLPRMLHEKSLVLRETLDDDGVTTCWEAMPLAEIESLASRQQTRRRAA